MQILPHTTQETWQKRMNILSELYTQAGLVFGENLQTHSIWDVSVFLRGNIELHITDHSIGYRERAFFFALIEQIDFSVLEEILHALKTLHEMVSKYQPGISVGQLVDETLEWEDSMTHIGVSDDGSKRLWFHVSQLSLGQQKSCMDTLSQISILYNQIYVPYMLVGAVTLSVQSNYSIINLTHFEEVLARITLMPDYTKDLEEWIVLFRYLGQSFYGRDAEMMEWATDFVMNILVEKEMFDDGFEVDHLLCIVALHMGYYDFADSLDTVQNILMKKNFWSAYCLGVPVEHMIYGALANQTFLNGYLDRCFTFADILRTHTQVIYYVSSGKNLTVGDFLSQFATQVQGKTALGVDEMSFVQSNMKEFGLPKNVESYLHALIYFFVHLQNADIIDYRGMLSDAGQKEFYDWQGALDHELSPEEIEKLKEYLHILERSTRVKMELVVAFQKINWKEEPYLHRVLLLSSIFEEMHHPLFGPLVFFNDKTQDWEINKEIPDMWGFSLDKKDEQPV